MKRGWIASLIMGFTIVVSSWVFPNFSWSETANPQQSQAIPENQILVGQQLDPKNPCQKLDEKQKEVCEFLKIKELLANPNIDLEKHALGNFVETVQKVNDILIKPETFRPLSNHPVQLVRNLGFSSIADLSKAVVGPALLVRLVRLSELMKFKGDVMKPDEVIDAGYTMIVPLDDPDEKISKSSIWFSIKREEKEWRWTKRGLPNLIRKIHRYRNGAQEMIEIPGLNLRFLGVRTGELLMLIPLKDAHIGTLDLKEGKAKPAKEVLDKLSSVANEIIRKNGQDEIIVGRPPVR